METEQHKTSKITVKLSDYTQSQIFITIFVVLLTFIAFYIYKKRKGARTDFLLLGLSESGKTLVFSQLLYSKHRSTFTSISVNVGEYLSGRGAVRVIDIPGHERLRTNFFEQYKNKAKGIVFVVDSVTVQKDIKDVADYLCTILTDTAVTNVPILILCNKQDETMAKGCNIIKCLLERELNVIRITRINQLQSVDDSEKTSAFLGRQGKDFEFSQVSQNVQVVECSALKQELNQLADWIDRIV